MEAAVSALHDDYDVSAHVAGLSVLVKALGNAALPTHLSRLASLVTHPALHVHVAAVHALRKHRPSTTDRVLASLLPPVGRDPAAPTPPPAARDAALDVVQDQRVPSAFMQDHLRTVLTSFETLHGDHVLGCHGACWATCNQGVCVTL